MTAPRYHRALGREDSSSERYPGRSRGHRFTVLVDGADGAAHLGLGRARLDPGGAIDAHLQAHEETFFVREGRGTLTLDGIAIAVEAGDAGAIPVGATHAWAADDGARLEWIEATAPPPVRDDRIDTIFRPAVGPPSLALPAAHPAVRHAVSWRGFGHDRPYGDRWPPPGTEARVIAAAPGILMQELVGTTTGAYLQRMLAVEFAPGSGMNSTSHDHPFEEAFVVLQGTVEARIDGEPVRLAAGDALWIAVGVPHGWANVGEATARWLEIQSPQPPLRHGIRRPQQWERLAAEIAAGTG